MVVNCCAVNCSTTPASGCYKSGAIRLHRVPKDITRRRQWAVAIRRKADDGGLWIPNYGAMLCSRHFTEADMDRTGQTVRLREGVTPSLFSYESPIKRKYKHGRKQLLSQEELNKLLDDHQRLNSSSMTPPEVEAKPPSPDPTTGPSAQSTIRVRDFSTKSTLLTEYSDNVSGKAAHGPEPNLPDKGTVPSAREHNYMLPNSHTVEEPDDPGDGDEMSLPEMSPPLTAPDPLNLPYGVLTRHLTTMKNKQHRMQHLQKTYSNLLDKVELGKCHSASGSGKLGEPSPKTPLLTLRHDRTERDQPLETIPTLSQDTLLPLTPNEAWKTISALREQVLDLQLALMNSRIQTLDVDLQLQEARAGHNRYKNDVKEEIKQTQKTQKASVREVEKRCDMPCLICPKLKRKLALMEKDTNKKLRRAASLSKSLEQIFTPMQMRVIRTGKTPRWGEEDVKRAIELRMHVSRRGYTFIRQNLGIPLPTMPILSRGVERFQSLQPLYDKMVIKNTKRLRKSKSEMSSHSSEKKRRLTDGSLITNSGPQSTGRPLERRKKRQAAQPRPHECVHSSTMEIVLLDTQRACQQTSSSHNGLTDGDSRDIDRVKSGEVQDSCEWEMDDEMLEELTRPRKM